jgi:hypothetical protein
VNFLVELGLLFCGFQLYLLKRLYPGEERMKFRLFFFKRDPELEFLKSLWGLGTDEE